MPASERETSIVPLRPLFDGSQLIRSRRGFWQRQVLFMIVYRNASGKALSTVKQMGTDALLRA
ncbi:hypothetical protein [Ktedonospora formicarum]|uniref:hypothetical protein n=1 Tax=Ktedonospora formicarum TaxID=2778364 RepID=UPI001C68BF50|nr:hypothetical protein [Ktedonospora formicarum]